MAADHQWTDEVYDLIVAGLRKDHPYMKTDAVLRTAVRCLEDIATNIEEE